MKKVYLAGTMLGLLLAVLAVTLLSTSLAAAASKGKTTICHMTGSESNPVVVITVSDNALPAHETHGDLPFNGYDADGNPICGEPGCEPGVCGSYEECSDPDSCPGPPNAPPGSYCFMLYDGSGACIHNYWCGDVASCPSGPSDCGVGEACVINSCCGVNNCLPPAYFCPAP